MNPKNYLLTLLTVLLIGGAAFAQTIVDVHGQLSIQGTKVKDECGRNAQLKGMSFFWHQWGGIGGASSYRFMNANVMQWLRDDWKVEIVRIPIAVRSGDKCSVLGTQSLVAGDCQDNPTGITGKQWAYTTARTAIQAAIDKGLYVIIDWHAHPNEKAAAKEFFRTMAQEYGNNPNVIYEIWNEPIGEYEGGPATWSEIKSYAKEVIAEIRAYDPDNVIVVGTPFYDQFVDIAADDPLTVDSQGNAVSNIAYTLHVYAAAHKQGIRDRANYAIGKGLALMMTESGRTGTNYGPDNTLDPAEWNVWENWMDQNNISYCKWSLSNKNEVSSSLTLSASTTGNWNYTNDLTPEGRWNRDHFRSVNSRRPSVCEDNPGTGNVTVRARGAVGGEQIEIRYKDQRVGDRITLGTTFQEYKVQVNNPTGNFKVAFVNDNGSYDAIIDWLQVGTTKREAESRATNTGAWGSGTCGGGTKTQIINCNGYIDFGSFNSAAGTIVVRAKGDCGIEDMELRVNGTLVKTWQNVATSFTNYTYSGFSGLGEISVHFINNDNAEADCSDKNLEVDWIKVCGTTYQTETVATETSTCCKENKSKLFTNGNFNFGNIAGGSSRTAASDTPKNLRQDVADEGADGFRMYPNPASQELTVEGRVDYQVTLYDLGGRAVIQHQHLNGSVDLDIRHLRPGVYMMKVRDAEHREVHRKIIIE